ncbi:MAG: efflux RND transporter periplasmic adaptor subunit [Nitrospirota bacterium]|jgi:RND family efflux transporter MFP subunit
MRVLFILFMSVALAFGGVAFAQPEGQGKEEAPKKEEAQKGGAAQRPALVTVVEITEGAVQPMSEFVGTVFYPRVSRVAPEVSGKAKEVRFEEGQRVRKGQALVVLDSEILDANIASTEASHERVLVQLEKARKDFSRIEALYRDESVSESLYDEYFFNVKGLEKQAESLAADLKRLRLEKDKTTIAAPFDGAVLEKLVEKGQWVSPSGEVAVLASDGEMDVIVDVPERILGFLSKGQKVTVRAGGRELKGGIWAFIPKGDVATRTFPVKIRVSNPGDSLKEGMEARALLPSAGRIEGLMAPRNAVIKKFGMDVVFAIQDSTARMVPVEVTGYDGMMVGLSGPGLQPGTRVAMEGNERVMDGQPVQIVGGNGADEPR